MKPDMHAPRPGKGQSDDAEPNIMAFPVWTRRALERAVQEAVRPLLLDQRDILVRRIRALLAEQEGRRRREGGDDGS